MLAFALAFGLIANAAIRRARHIAAAPIAGVTLGMSADEVRDRFRLRRSGRFSDTAGALHWNAYAITPGTPERATFTFDGGDLATITIEWPPDTHPADLFTSLGLTGHAPPPDTPTPHGQSQLLLTGDASFTL